MSEPHPTADMGSDEPDADVVGNLGFDAHEEAQQTNMDHEELSQRATETMQKAGEFLDQRRMGDYDFDLEDVFEPFANGDTHLSKPNLASITVLVSNLADEVHDLQRDVDRLQERNQDLIDDRQQTVDNVGLVEYLKRRFL